LSNARHDYSNRGRWLIDGLSDDLVQIHGIKRILHETTTKYQQAQIIDTTTFGMCLVLDGKIQSGELDEFIYHESLVHPAMIAHSNPESVFIAGGGEGATLRDVLLHKTVKKAVMVDIDEEVVRLCEKYLPTFHRGSFDDKRAEVRFEDARKYISETRERFDVALIDLADPVEEGPARFLYTREFYQLVKSKLKPGGIMSVQSGQCGWINLDNFLAINGTLKSIFKFVRPYHVYVPSFVDLWGFHSVSDDVDVNGLPSREINRRVRERVSRDLRTYDGVAHAGMFSLPKRLRRRLLRARKVITDQTPISVK
jgi:spermidine synthase